MSKNYYIDMDGVYVKYETDAYVGENPRYLRKNEHYYLNCKPDRKMLEVVDELHRKCKYTGDDMFFLTSLAINGAIFNEQFHDKISYINHWAPYMDINHILISVTSKREAVEYIKNHVLTKDDILIDDYNKNLIDWELAGGTAIKYCNDINNPDSFDGLKLYHTDSVANIIATLDSL